ncbi:MAG: RluA family pseudouridine synthase [Clostridia bacterium]|nr:RluA family pseudouridine synthase [Clostridia bacterium]
MKSFTVTKNDAGQRVDKFVSKVCPTLPTSLLYKSIRTKNIKLNGKRCEISTRLNEGDVLSLYIKDEFFVEVKPKYDFLKAGNQLDIVYEDENILLADKKQGLLVHPDENEYNDTLIGRIQRYLYEKGEYDPQNENSFRPALANRIDRNTGGIVIAAKNAEALRILCEKIKSREIDKRYLAVIHGVPKQSSATLEGYLEKNEQKNKVYLCREKRDDNRTICTRYRTLASKERLSLIEVELITGRTHQIRAHMASIGHPLLGDGKYGRLAADKKLGFDKQALYSYKLTFDFKEDAGSLQYLNGRTFKVKQVWFAEKLFGIGVNGIK